MTGIFILCEQYGGVINYTIQYAADLWSSIRMQNN